MLLFSPTFPLFSYFEHPHKSLFLPTHLAVTLHKYHTNITAALASMHSPEYKMMFLNFPIPYCSVSTSAESKAELIGPVARLPMPLSHAKAEKVTRAKEGEGDKAVP